MGPWTGLCFSVFFFVFFSHPPPPLSLVALCYGVIAADCGARGRNACVRMDVDVDVDMECGCV